MEWWAVVGYVLAAVIVGRRVRRKIFTMALAEDSNSLQEVRWMSAGLGVVFGVIWPVTLILAALVKLTDPRDSRDYWGNRE